MLVIYITSICIAYLVGSISSAIIVCKFFNLPDPRTFGSKNPGATNVLRSSGSNKLPAILTLIGDLLKGLLPGLLITYWYPEEYLLHSIIVLAVFLGHLFPIFFSFKGGKGVATAIGGLLALNYLAALAITTVWLLIFLIFKISSLSAIIACVSTVPILYWLDINFLHHVYAISVLCLLLLWRHRANIERLIVGTEKKISKK